MLTPDQIQSFRSQYGLDKTSSGPTAPQNNADPNQLNSRLQGLKDAASGKQLPGPNDNSNNNAPQKPGFFSSIAKGLLNVPLRAGVELYNVDKQIKSAVTDPNLGYALKHPNALVLKNTGLDTPRTIGPLGPVKPTLTNSSKPGLRQAVDVAGQGVEAASYVVGGEALKGAQTVGQAALMGVEAGGESGLLYGAGNAAQQDNATPKSIARGGVIGATTGAATGALINGGSKLLSNNLPSLLKQSAANDYTKVLKPTTNANKELAAKVAPGLADRNVVVMTRQGLEDKATQAIQDTGAQIEQEWAKLDPSTKLKTNGTLEALGNLKNSFTVTGADGKQVIIDEVGYRNAQQVEQTVMRLGNDISSESMRTARQILDKATHSPTKGVLRVQTSTEASLANAQRTAADAFRTELNQATPNIGKLNAEYNFWKNVQTVIGATNDRLTGKGMSATEKAVDLTAGAAGFAKKGFGFAAAASIVTDTLYKIVTSPAFKTIGAVTKNALADALAKGDSQAFNNIATKILTNTVTKKILGNK